MFNKVAIIGTGLMGGSLAMALKECGEVAEVSVFDADSQTRKAARKLGIADTYAHDPAEAARGCDLLVLATPIGQMIGALDKALPAIEPPAILTDLASAKIGIMRSIRDTIPTGVRYVGGHPMTGSEQSGVHFARADLFRDRYYILTPDELTDTDAFQRLHSLLTRIGARVISMDPESHDRAMATVSHVPHLLSLLLMEMAAREQERMKNIYTVAAGGFRDMTRIAASNPGMWLDIIAENRVLVIERLKDYSAAVDRLIDMLEKDDQAALETLFVQASEARRELTRKSGAEISELYAISLPVPDEPGVISRITMAVGSLGVNIEDISIAHPLEGETGIMTLSVLGEEAAREAATHLESAGYRVSMGKA